MHLFEYPYIIITVFILCFAVLGAVGIYFGIKGVKTANGKDENKFTTISKMESNFEKSGKLRENRCVLYINVYLDDFRSLYSDVQTESVFSEIKSILLDMFSENEGDAISVYGEKVETAEAGDVNEDTKIDILDAVQLYKHLNDNTFSVANGDVDKSGVVDAADLSALRAILLNK